jgi:tetratricopeptide (TPR) repeat protein
VERQQFVEPMASTATCALTLAGTQTGSVLTWSMEGNHNFLGKALGMFMDMDTMLGTDIEKGLAQLKNVADQERLKQGTPRVDQWTGLRGSESPGGQGMFRALCVCAVFLTSAALGSTGEDVERQLASKRREQIESLRKIVSLSGDPTEQASVLLRLGELYFEESRFLQREAKLQNDEQLRAKALENRRAAVEQLTKIIQGYPTFAQSDEALLFLGNLLMEDGQDKKALVAYKRLLEKYPRSRYVPDAYLALGEYFFTNAKGQRKELERALQAYQKAAEFTESRSYLFALYMQGWCHFNLGDYAAAKEHFKKVVLQGEQASANAAEKHQGRDTLVREARIDYVNAYARDGDVLQARRTSASWPPGPRIASRC